MFTESYAAYLFIVIAIVMMVMAFLFKDKGAGWLFWLATFGWAMGAFYAFSVQGSLTSFIHFLGFFCVLASFGCGLMPIILRDKKQPPPRELTSQERAEMFEAEMRKRRYGGQVGYQDDGKRSPGW